MEKGTNPMIQITAFSTNHITNTPIDLIDIYLKNNLQHSVPLKTKHTSTFTILPFDSQLDYPNTKISFCFITDLTKDYSQMKLANCYVVFIELDIEESKDKIERIFAYINQKSVKNPKIYVFGMISNFKKSSSVFSKKDIQEYLALIEDFSYLYENFELASEKNITKKIGRFLQDLTDIYYFGEKENTVIDRPGESNSGSCIIV